MPTTDGGSDVAKFRRMLRVELRNSVSDLVIDCNCLMHADHLIVKSALVLVDAWCVRNKTGWRWFSALAILTNTWRDCARVMFSTAAELKKPAGAEVALKHFKKMPPRCLAGRWHSVSLAVKRKLDVGPHEIKWFVRRAPTLST